jgi:hypothetical protein
MLLRLWGREVYIIPSPGFELRPTPHWQRGAHLLCYSMTAKSCFNTSSLFLFESGRV